MKNVWRWVGVWLSVIGAPLAYAGGDIEVSREAVVNASPTAVWKMIGHFNHLDVWHPAVVASELTGSGTKAGDRRLLTLADGAKIDEKLQAHDDREHTYTYEILESPLPVENYVSTIGVSAAVDGKARVVWSSTFDAKGVAAAEAEKVIGGIYEAGLEALVKHFGG